LVDEHPVAILEAVFKQASTPDPEQALHYPPDKVYPDEHLTADGTAQTLVPEVH
jgi:hypothetical protein